VPVSEDADVNAKVDEYLASLDEPGRTALAALRETIQELVPDVEECISYGMPAYKLDGKVIAGFAAFKNHLSYVPHSGSVIAGLSEELSQYRATKSSLHFPVDRPLPRELVEKLLAARMAEARSGVDHQ
jgi:uncharacterized protein YdhG (YjbR/CyaY superfamily)